MIINMVIHSCRQTSAIRATRKVLMVPIIYSILAPRILRYLSFTNRLAIAFGQGV
jgi:hypothetical protein